MAEVRSQDVSGNDEHVVTETETRYFRQYKDRRQGPRAIFDGELWFMAHTSGPHDMPEAADDSTWDDHDAWHCDTRIVECTVTVTTTVLGCEGCGRLVRDDGITRNGRNWHIDCDIREHELSQVD